MNSANKTIPVSMENKYVFSLSARIAIVYHSSHSSSPSLIYYHNHRRYNRHHHQKPFWVGSARGNMLIYAVTSRSSVKVATCSSSGDW